MKIMRVNSKKVGNKTYYKYNVTIPADVVKDSKLIDKKLRATAENEKIIIERED